MLEDQDSGDGVEDEDGGEQQQLDAEAEATDVVDVPARADAEGGCISMPATKKVKASDYFETHRLNQAEEASDFRENFVRS